MVDVTKNDVLTPQISGQIDNAILAEFGVRPTALDIDRHQLLGGSGDEDSLFDPVGPILEATSEVVGEHGPRVLVDLRIVDPDLLTATSLDRRDLAQLGRYVHPTADHQRSGPPPHQPTDRSSGEGCRTVLVPGAARALLSGGDGAELLLDSAIGRLPAPPNLEPCEVPGVDLAQRRVTREGVVAAMMAPLAIDRSLLAEDTGSPRSGGHRRNRYPPASGFSRAMKVVH